MASGSITIYPVEWSDVDFTICKDEMPEGVDGEAYAPGTAMTIPDGYCGYYVMIENNSEDMILGFRYHTNKGETVRGPWLALQFGAALLLFLNFI